MEKKLERMKNERESCAHKKNRMRTKNGCIQRALWSRSKSRNKSKLLFIFAFEMLLTDEKKKERMRALYELGWRRRRRLQLLSTLWSICIMDSISCRLTTQHRASCWDIQLDSTHHHYENNAQLYWKQVFCAHLKNSLSFLYHLTELSLRRPIS